MVGNFAIVRVGAAVQQQLCQFGIMSYSSGTVEHAFPRGFRLVLGIIESGLRISAGVEQGGGCADECRGP